MNWQVVKYRHPTLFVRQNGKIYEFKVNEDGTIEHDGSLSAQLRDASAYLSRYGLPVDGPEPRSAVIQFGVSHRMPDVLVA
jgi:hypothetical protein